MTVWFTSDTHFGHRNVIEYSNRPFEHVDEMNETLIRNWNERVQPGDSVYHLGDFALCPEKDAVNILRRLSGQKFLVWGNHDKRLRKNKDFIAFWTKTDNMMDIKVGEQRIVLCHFPMLTWNKSHHGSWNLHGHCHGSLPDDPHSLRIDVGVDPWQMHPVSYEELAERMALKRFVPVDHHGARDHEAD